MLRELKNRAFRWLVGENLYAHRRHALGRDDLAVRLNVKNLGYAVARDLVPALRMVSPAGEPHVRTASWKPSTQKDVDSSWFAFWCAELKIAPVYHRKLWEYAYVLQTLHDEGLLREGATAVGFGCGEEPIASYLASRGVRVIVTDLDPARAKGLGWMETGQHASALDVAFRPELVSHEVFRHLVSIEYVDMNEIPTRFAGRFDFCWSICAFEHLGSIDNGLRFVERAMDALRDAGVAIHTSELSYLDEAPDVESGPTVLYRPRHYVELANRLVAAGHEVPPLDFDVGSDPLDRFIDVPPYTWDSTAGERFGMNVAHLKLSVSGTPTTCFGLRVRKNRGTGARSAQ